MSEEQPLSIAVCIAAFNRRDKTLACLARLRDAALPAGARMQIYLLDDASTDGTGDAVRAAFPEVRLLTSQGDSWWAGGMRIAYGAALADGHDFYIWMNDDVEIKPDAVMTLLDAYHTLKRADGKEHLLSGPMQDRSTGKTSYGGFALTSRWRPSYRMVVPEADRPVPVDLVNGNMLLVPAAIANRLGNIPDGFTHTLADWDYGLRARAVGAGLWLAPGHVGYCSPNVAGRRRWAGSGLSLKERYSRMTHPLALEWTGRSVFLRHHFPATAPLLLVVPYLKLPLDHVLWRVGLKKHQG